VQKQQRRSLTRPPHFERDVADLDALHMRHPVLNSEGLNRDCAAEGWWRLISYCGILSYADALWRSLW
jgi:hypothetical protein